MRPRTSLVIAGALLVTLVPGAARATQPEPAAVAVAVADDGTVTVRSNGDLVGVFTLDEDGRTTVDGIDIATDSGTMTIGPDPQTVDDGNVTDNVMTVELNGDMATLPD